MVKVWLAPIDITTVEVDAVVCAANSGLVLGCGVAGFIWRRGGQVIQDECDRIGKIAPGEVAVTTAGALPARHVFHAVSMGYRHPDVAALLRGVTTRCLDALAERGLQSIVFPAIAAGRMKLPPEDSCRHMGEAVAGYDYDGTSIRSVGFALLDPRAHAVFAAELPRMITANPQLVMTDELPRVVDMPWRTETGAG